jgi:UPF0755 protein
VLCIAALGAGIAFIGLPETLVDIGPVSPVLEPVERLSLTAYLLLHLNELNSPISNPTQVVELVVSQGDSAATVVADLEAGEFLQDGTLLRNYLRYRGLDTSIEAGGYLLHGAMTVREVAEALQTAEATDWTVTVVEGWRREQIAEALRGTDLRFSPDEFLDATESAPEAYSLSGKIPLGLSLDGYLFPDTYSLDQDTSAEDFVKKMLENLESRITTEMMAGFQAQGLNLHNALTLASIVEREAVVPDERELIASVFLNRLSLNMKLEADPTVQYALGQQPDGSWWKAALTLVDLEINSPFNTYRFEGLPVGPICNPGLESLRAVAFPATTPYLYFRAMCDGSGRHFFAETFEEHQLNACE